MPRYKVKANEFRYGGRVLRAGDDFEDRDTIEIRTHQALGNIEEATEGQQAAPAAPRRGRPPKYLTQQMEAAKSDENDPAKSVEPMSTDGGLTGERRRYFRRDLKAEE
jgi:hypothetical protein